MFKVVKVKGDSMLPCYRHNDYLLVSRYHCRPLKAGDDIVCNHPRFNTILKRIDHIDKNEIRLKGLNSLSTSSDDLGTIHQTDVIGKVIWHIKQPAQKH